MWENGKRFETNRNYKLVDISILNNEFSSDLKPVNLFSRYIKIAKWNTTDKQVRSYNSVSIFCKRWRKTLKIKVVGKFTDH